MKKITSVLFSALIGLGLASGAAQAADGSLDKIKARASGLKRPFRVRECS